MYGHGFFMYAMVYTDMDHFLLLKRNMDYTKLHWHGKLYVLIGCKQTNCFSELSSYRKPLIHAFEVNCP